MLENNLLLRLEDLVNNPTPRIPVCLCLDTSGSMDGTPINQLNEAVKLFYEEMREKEDTLDSAEISIVTFGGEYKCIEDFGSLERQVNIPTLYASGMTPMGEGVNLALDLLEKRKEEYKDKGVDYFQPWLVLMTDGEPNGDDSEFARAKTRIAELVANKKLVVLPIGIGGDADMGKLAELSPGRRPLKLQGLKFREFFQWLGKSMEKRSQSMPGTKLNLDPVSDWATLD